MKTFTKGRHGLVAMGVALTALAGIGGFVVAGGEANDSATITACYKSNGSVRIVPANTSCHRSETRLEWNKQGPIGTTGAAGAQGNTGAAGPQGDTGAAGTPGSDGAKGDTGAAGAAGAAGATGPQGDTGAAGTPGSDGAKGDTGAAGAAGAIGPQGDTGAAGAAGPAGPQGPAGPRGPAGDGGGGGGVQSSDIVASLFLQIGHGSSDQIRGPSVADGKEFAFEIDAFDQTFSRLPDTGPSGFIDASAEPLRVTGEWSPEVVKLIEAANEHKIVGDMTLSACRLDPLRSSLFCFLEITIPSATISEIAMTDCDDCDVGEYRMSLDGATRVVRYIGLDETGPDVPVDFGYDFDTDVAVMGGLLSGGTPSPLVYRMAADLGVFTNVEAYSYSHEIGASDGAPTSHSSIELQTLGVDRSTVGIFQQLVSAPTGTLAIRRCSRWEQALPLTCRSMRTITAEPMTVTGLTIDESLVNKVTATYDRITWSDELLDPDGQPTTITTNWSLLANDHF